jgi:hypothetical protein
MKNLNQVIFKVFLLSISICVILVTTYSCKKKSNLTFEINGSVVDTILMTGVMNAKVELYAKERDPSVFNPAFKLLATTNTNSEGSYYIKIEDAFLVEVRIEVSKNNYMEEINFIAESELESTSSITPRTAFIPQGILALTLVNKTDANKTTFNLFNKKTDCVGCCGNNKQTIETKEDTTLYCRTYGKSVTEITGFYFRDSLILPFDTNVFCKSIDTTYFEIFY